MDMKGWCPIQQAISSPTYLISTSSSSSSWFRHAETKIVVYSHLSTSFNFFCNWFLEDMKWGSIRHPQVMIFSPYQMHRSPVVEQLGSPDRTTRLVFNEILVLVLALHWWLFDGWYCFVSHFETSLTILQFRINKGVFWCTWDHDLVRAKANLDSTVS